MSHSHEHSSHDNQSHGGHQHGGHNHGNHQHGFDAGRTDAALAELLDLDAAVHHAHLADLTARAREHRTGTPTRRVLDLGAGTGTGTLALAHRFPRAEITAVDASETMLERIRAKALADGVADRVLTVAADLDEVSDDGSWPRDAAFTGPYDLVWASASLHHLANPGAGLRRLLDVTAPDGLLVAIEMDGQPWFLPDDVGVGRPGFETRLHALIDAARGDMDPHPDWTPTLGRAGWDQVERRTTTPAATSGTTPALARYAQHFLSWMAPAIGHDLEDDDRATLQVLLGDGPLGVSCRGDLSVRGTRTVWFARPAASAS